MEPSLESMDAKIPCGIPEVGIKFRFIEEQSINGVHLLVLMTLLFSNYFISLAGPVLSLDISHASRARIRFKIRGDVLQDGSQRVDIR